MRGIWSRPWGKHRYHLFVVVEGASPRKGFLEVRAACPALRLRRGEVKYFDALEDPAPPSKAFPNCTSCVKAYKALWARPAQERTSP